MSEEQRNTYTAAHYTITGFQCARTTPESSEDLLLIDRHRGMIAVLDAVGGRGNGRLAAAAAAQVLQVKWKEAELAEEALSLLIQQADERVASLIIPEDQRRPGTTVVLAALASSHVIYAHVGDSRIYLFREEHLQRLTRDDGYFSFAVQKGRLSQENSARIEQATESAELSEDDLQHFHARNKITCAVGWSDFRVHTGRLLLHDGDRLLLCSDGLHDNLTDREIADLLNAPLATSAESLVRAATQRSHQEEHLRAKQDDISAIVVGYHTPLDTNAPDKQI